MKALSLTAFAVGILGFGSVVLGVGLVSVPAALIVGGAVAIAWSAFTARAVARARKRKG